MMALRLALIAWQVIGVRRHGTISRQLSCRLGGFHFGDELGGALCR